MIYRAYRRLLTCQMQHDAAAVRSRAVFEHVNSLPGAQCEPGIDDRDGQLRLRKRGADMRRHVIGTLGGVAVPGCVFGNDARKELIEITYHVGVGVFLDDQRSRGVLNKHRQQPRADALAVRPLFDLSGDGIQTFAPRGNLDAVRELLQWSPTSRQPFGGEVPGLCAGEGARPTYDSLATACFTPR